MGKLNIRPRTLDEEIVKDGLSAVSTIFSDSTLKYESFVVGGVATQSYLPSRCRRPTSDIDLAVLRPLSYSEFRVVSRPVWEWLSDKHYNVELDKGHNSYQIVYSDEHGNSSLIEFSRKSKAYVEKVGKRLEEEMRRGRMKIVEGRDVSCRFASPEDIAIPKIVRSINALDRHPELMEDMPFGANVHITDTEIAAKLKMIYKLREEATIHAGDLMRTQRLRFCSDMFDVRLLSELTGYNESDFAASMTNWSTFHSQPEFTQIVFNNVLPKGSIGKLLKYG